MCKTNFLLYVIFSLQEQLNKMREEYDRIQRRMKEQMKRTTPFERIRKFFGRGKPKRKFKFIIFMSNL